MTHRSKNFVVEMRIHREHRRPRFLPQRPHPFECLRIRLFGGRHDAPHSRKKVLRPRGDARFLLAGDGMRADKMDAVRHEPFALLD